MNILGIHDGHNASVALFQDGEITYAVSEERLTRVKNQGGFPAHAIERVLSDADLAVDDLDMVSLCGIRPHRPEWVHKDLILGRYKQYCQYHPSVLEEVRSQAIKMLPVVTVAYLRKLFRPRTYRLVQNLERERLALISGLGIPKDRVFRFEHHACHAAGAYYGQGGLEEPVLVMTCDGGGDGICCSVRIGRNGRLQRLATIPVEDSIAKLYALITCMLGLVPLEHEYKVMGLAPYADSVAAGELADYMAGHFEWDENSLRWHRKKGLPATAYWRDIIHKEMGFQRFDVVAAGFQRFIERMMVRWVRGWLEETGLRRLALSGGIFMNVKMNKVLMELDEVDSLYVLPSCGDESNPIGACYLAAIQAGAAPGDVSPLGPLYLGPRYTEEDITRAIKAFRENTEVSVERHDFIEGVVAKHLARGEIVARYEGREEFGARALGNRSILADPSRLNLIREINQMIKCRDFWMPFAGTMTESQAERNLINPKGIAAAYMIITFDSAAAYEEYQAATHPYDRTIRPQVLNEAWNPSYHRILTEFERLTGKRGGLLNTSFNLHGYPIVSSPEDALDVFARSGLIHLAIGRYLLSKRAGV